MKGPITLGRSDAILACSAIELVLQANLYKHAEDIEEVENLLRFIMIQLDSIAEEERSALAHIWKPIDFELKESLDKEYE